MLKWKRQRQTDIGILSSNHQQLNHQKIMSSSSSSRHPVETVMERLFRKKSLGQQKNSMIMQSTNNNKENFGIYFSPNNQHRKSLTPLQDLSNGQSPKIDTIHDNKRLPSLNQSSLAQLYPCTDGEMKDSPYSLIANASTSEKLDFSDAFVVKSRKSKDLRQSELCATNQEESLSSSRIGDTTLDKMIDAIIESARREEKRVKRIRHQSDSFDDFYEPSIHEMEVKTPPTHHLKRQKVVRRKNKSEPPAKDKKDAKARIGLTLPNGIPSPETPVARCPKSNKTFEELVEMNTPQEMVFVVDSIPAGKTSSNNSSCRNNADDDDDNICLQRCSTPTNFENKTNSIRRCLSFSPNSDDDISQNAGKRDSVASSTSSTRTFNRSVSIRGSVDLAIFEENGNLNVHVIRCRGLERPNGSSDVNAYVKVALLPPDPENDSNFKRTAVHRNSSRPYFDHKFKFEIHGEKNLWKRVQLAVWHRDRVLKRSEFLGCMSFPVKSILKSAINGSYKLQSQECLTNPVPPIPLATVTGPVLHNNPCPLSSSTISTNPVPTTLINKNCISSRADNNNMAAAADRRQQSVEEDVISIDSTSATTTGQAHVTETGTGQPIAFSKKAIHQRDADENLFLRFLELDPPHELGSIAGGSGHNRRMSTFKPALGRTPFTITKKLTRTPDKGFGFSIVWTHPPRVEKVEPGMPADRAGIHPGDYVIFVDKHNVVTMPEADVLNLIRSHGNSLTLEIFRRTSSSGVPALNANRSAIINGAAKPRVASAASNYTYEEMSPAVKQSVGLGGQRSSTACSNTSIETTKRRLHLPQVTFSKESIAPIHGVDDHRRRLLLQLVSREQNYVNALHFGMQRFVQPLNERKDLISPNDHRTLFQNIDELLRISEDILEQLTQDDHEPQLNFASRVYLSKTTAICAAYKKYCNGIKRADCVLVNKSRQPGSDFVAFITEPQVPRKRPDLTMFIHRPLQHFREILKLMQLLASHCHVDSEEHRNFTSVINELQAAYREITVGGGLMEPLGEGRPLLTLQDLESRMVFTRCKPFTLAVQGRQWIFGGDLSRVEGRSIKPYWTLLFSDIIVFAKVSRDRVLFITEEPLPIANIVDSCFNIRKKTTEFRITVDPNGRFAESPTGYCAPDLTRTPKKSMKRKTIILRAPSLELKAVWQNLLQRQIFLVNAALGSTPLSSPLDSPDVLNTIVPLSDIGATTASMGSMKISSMDSINLKNQQNRQVNPAQHLEQLIDEKCRILNKTGTPKGSALHLANWMKGQLDKQQEQARLAAAQSKERLDKEDAHLLENTDEYDEKITYWTREQLEKRTKELNLAKEGINAKHGSSNRRNSGVEEIGVSDTESEMKSPSRSTTSDSQITVRSSPNANIIDKLSVCRHCHKNCKQKMSSSPPLLNYSLKVQHSQASPNRCCQLSSGISTGETSNNASESSQIASNNVDRGSISTTVSSTSSTVTGDRQILIENITTSTTVTNESNQNLDKASLPSTPASTTRLLLNGTCSGSESDHDSRKASTTTITPSTSPTTTITTVTMSSCQKKLPFHHRKRISHMPCTCKCTPEDFSNATLSPDELKQETCKILDDVSQLKSPQTEPSPAPSFQIHKENPHKNCKCVCKDKQNGNQTESDTKSEEELSLVLIGLAQFNPAVKLVSSDSFVPTISVVPPTPEAVLTKTATNIWDNTTSTATKLTINNIPGQVIIENIPEDSPDESPQDEEPPYRSLNTKLRRYGTMSSLEKLPLEDIRGVVEHSSEEGEEDEEDENGDGGEEEEAGDDDEDDDIEVITRQVFTGNENNQASLRNWTARAGSYVAEKMSFFEESRAFIDKYLGRWNQEQNEHERGGEEEQVEECTSGATSGEEVWGTPTSGGDNEDMQMGSSEHTQSSPTKSNSSLNDDDDTELMMDELLMAPPMTASTIRGLLPRRRLEPLFEEETESDEEKAQLESDVSTKGETSTNGNDLEFSIGRLRSDGLSHFHTISHSYQHSQLLKTTSITSTEMDTREEQIPKVTTVSAMIKTTSTNSTDSNKNITNNSSSTIMTSTSTVMTSSSSIMSSTTTTTTTSSTVSTAETTTNIVRRAKFSPPPPPPRRLLLTQTDSKGTNTHTPNQDTQDQSKENFGDTADIGFLVGVPKRIQPTNIVNNTIGNQKAVSNMKSSVENTDHTEVRQSTTTEKSISSAIATITSSTITTTVTTSTTSAVSTVPETQSTTSTERTITVSQSQTQPQKAAVLGSGLSPRLEMRLALNHDILGDEDLISYDPGPDLATILGHDLSTFHRLTGRDLLNRSVNRIQPKEAVISYSQQRNSKMDTPTLNRKRHQQHHLQQQLQQNRNIWNNSAFADRTGGNDTNVGSCRSSNNSSDESKLSDLEILARREKMYCMSQLKNGSPARQAMTMKQTNMKAMMTRRSTSSIVLDPENPNRVEIKSNDSKASRILNFLTRRNSENQLTKIISRDSLTESTPSSTPTPDRRLISPRKDSDKPSLNRRFWKQLTKRRRAHSVSEIAAK